MLLIPSVRPLFRHHLTKRFFKRSIPHGARVYDVGCGRGDFIFWLAQRGYEAHGFEFSPQAIKRFKALRAYYKIHNARLHELDFFEHTPERADVITCFEVLEHLEDDTRAVRLMREWLRDDGYLVITVPAHMRLWGRDDEVYGHVRRYERKKLRNLLESNGFVIYRFASYGYPWLNILKKIRELHMKIRPPKFVDQHSQQMRTQRSGVGFFKSKFLGLFLNPLTFYPLILFSNLFNRTDISEGYFVVARKC
ncbi:MAG: hypothetical protein COU08_02440 [Candidatus Harrisonbacteria bacterium CG10_big_fil_rev_8_21_14_0_10_42_17]|uniref:Class I SAM-dependent methyltransferase n=1 Tax=Candidatus Harrisonbacteria bacterium CG10_big_fil_rev_8_21_14_0_10_42_17 TaxID=1974584 RepID=A0A2M6WI03_9BACT|nr:MAG: hypothetical protein COU08_02440 [Candidatus Harrisonbacteria bacterium CG10_big_fil_rev_8_21_14_0_10_42_17]